MPTIGQRHARAHHRSDPYRSRAGFCTVPHATASRIVAIGDIHGAYAEYTTALKRAGLIDEQLKWSGGRATLVQTGDYTDRGTDVRKVLDLLMQIEREARRRAEWWCRCWAITR